MKVVCLDLEGVLMPEIWEKIAEKTSVEELNLTTRDVPDYEELMEHRFKHLRKNDIRINDIKDILSEIEPLPGAVDFFEWLQERTQVSILTGSFYQFLLPLIGHFNWPILFARNINWDQDGYLNSYNPKNPNIKKEAVKKFSQMGLKVAAVGDSFNDRGMLEVADKGVLFRPSEKVRRKLSDFPTAEDYEELRGVTEKFLESRS